MSANKDVRQLKALAIAQGWTVEPTKSSHIKWTPPNGGKFVITGAHPKQGRGFKNVQRSLERKGLRTGHNATPNTVADDHLVPVTPARYSGTEPESTDANKRKKAMGRPPNPIHEEILSTVYTFLQQHPGEHYSVDKLTKQVVTEHEYADVSNALSKAAHNESRRAEQGNTLHWPGLIKVPHRQSIYTYEDPYTLDGGEKGDPDLRRRGVTATAPPLAPPGPPYGSVSGADPELLVDPSARVGIQRPVIDDDELWTLLEMVLDGPAPLTRESMKLVIQWMDTTRHLKALMRHD